MNSLQGEYNKMPIQQQLGPNTSSYTSHWSWDEPNGPVQLPPHLPQARDATNVTAALTVIGHHFTTKKSDKTFSD